MIHRLISPSSLFFLGAVQSLFPYLHWTILGSNESYDYPITFFPALLILFGWLFFFLGTLVIRRKKIFKQPQINIKKVNWLMLLIAIILIVQLIFLLQLYGGYPIALYLRSEATILEMNLLQNNSFSGQLGLYNLTNFSLLGLLFIAVVYYLKNNSKFPKSIYLIFLLLVISVTFAGKRQGLLQIFVFFLCGLGVIWLKPLPLLYQSIFGKRLLWCRTLLLPILLVIIFLVFASIESLRINADSINIYNSFMTYLEWPLINFEYYFYANSFKILEFNSVATIGGFIPYKLAIQSASTDWTMLSNGLPESTAGLGFHGGNYSNYGLLGMFCYSFFTGVIAKFFYERSKNSIFYVMAYAQISWTLFFSHTYNFINSAAFLWAPILIYFFFCKLTIKSYKKFKP